MTNVLTQDDILPLLPKREPTSHKGQNGKVLFISGSAEFSGAPVLAALGALRSGCDLIHLYVPHENIEVTRSYQPEFIVRGFDGSTFTRDSIEGVEDWAAKSDCIVIGMGSKKDEDFLAAVKFLLGKFPDKKFVLDSNAIYALEGDCGYPNVLITPHKKELEGFSGAKTNILVTAAVDEITSYDGEVVTNKTGSPGMTVGGSGDVLAGLCGGLVAQGLELFDAGKAGAYLLGKAGEKLQETKGNAFSSTDLAEELARVLLEKSS